MNMMGNLRLEGHMPQKPPEKIIATIKKIKRIE